MESFRYLVALFYLGNIVIFMFSIGLWLSIRVKGDNINKTSAKLGIYATHSLYLSGIAINTINAIMGDMVFSIVINAIGVLVASFYYIGVENSPEVKKYRAIISK